MSAPNNLVSLAAIERRKAIAERAKPSPEYRRQLRRLSQQEKERGPGEFFGERPPKAPKPKAEPPKAANDNKPLKATSLGDLGAIWAYRNHKDHEPDPLQSSWSTQPADDNVTIAKSEKLGGEYLIRTRPSLEAIERAIKAGEEGDLEYYPNGTLARMGKIKFAGKDTHQRKVMVIGDLGDVVEEYETLHCGAVIGWREETTEPAGGKGTAVKLPNAQACKDFGFEPHTFKPKGETTKGRDYTNAECQAILDEVIANTPNMPPVTKCPTSIASGTACYSDQFIGGKIGSTGKGGAMQWFDVFAAKIDQEADRKAHDALSLTDKRTLQAALTAKSFADISPGGTERGARKRGRQMLVAANDNLQAAIKKYAK